MLAIWVVSVELVLRDAGDDALGFVGTAALFRRYTVQGQWEERWELIVLSPI